ncbi:hypothetical protein CBG25_06870 [Arsenophonus sp. ENCA]|uniref:shufflon system plasmid conjugative transfer pilus tip adhesin PilV n=1 Tax=Arsenophonus sp. ENCA TaxID=1987579 RepID=UPI000BD3DE52|nr:shufflon system plasmid conjugative transfer pilus tip adhesin PilV [Arsenophonus sp. ENCA]PAV04682.1 hypothetical protein CBG25_06870 [Arsenophonus sp. ENCA]
MKKIIQKNKHDIHRGFVSLEIMGALVIVAMAALFGAEKYSEYLDEQEWKVAARHVSQFNEAAKQYIADHRDELLNQPLPKRIIPSLLINKGYLQRGFAEKNGFGQQYVTGIVKNSAKGQPALQALTCSVQGDTLSEKGMRRIAALINGMGGYVDEKNIATGAYGGWTSQPRDFGLDCRHGHIAIALSSEILGSVLQESDRLYRFQVKHRPELNRMHTAIDMGDNDITRANVINANYFYPSSQVIAGATCYPDGTVSRIETGESVSCVKGKWARSSGVPIGTIVMWGGSVLPPDWLELNGQSFNKRQYPDLSLLYPSLKLPDFRGRFVRALDHGAGIDSEPSRSLTSFAPIKKRSIFKFNSA